MKMEVDGGGGWFERIQPSVNAEISAECHEKKTVQAVFLYPTEELS